MTPFFIGLISGDYFREGCCSKTRNSVVDKLVILQKLNQNKCSEGSDGATDVKHTIGSRWRDIPRVLMSEWARESVTVTHLEIKEAVNYTVSCLYKYSFGWIEFHLNKMIINKRQWKYVLRCYAHFEKISWNFVLGLSD